MQRELFVSDLEHILAHTRELWAPLRHGQVFITGGAGFFGSWLVESFLFANEALKLNATAAVLTRSGAVFEKKLPHLARHEGLQIVEGDMGDFDFPEGEFSHVIHAATQPVPEGAPANRAALFEADVGGTRRVLDFAASHGTRRLLFTSSGAIYGAQPAHVTHVSESYAGAPSSIEPGTAYGQGKRASEFLCVAKAREAHFDSVIARCFAFVGPRLPLDANYAVGNFTRDALAREPVKVGGDGTPFRSYLYAADLMIWLWTLLFRGAPGSAYNVGSDADLQIADLARMVAEVVNPKSRVEIARTRDSARPAQRYVPSIEKAHAELGLKTLIDLREGIRRMAEWNR